jgi:hypothetical protein
LWDRESFFRLGFSANASANAFAPLLPKGKRRWDASLTYRWHSSSNWEKSMRCELQHSYEQIACGDHRFCCYLTSNSLNKLESINPKLLRLT